MEAVIGFVMASCPLSYFNLLAAVHTCQPQMVTIAFFWTAGDDALQRIGRKLKCRTFFSVLAATHADG